MKTLVPYIIIALLLCLVLPTCNKTNVHTERYIDTVIVRDTIRDTLMVPQNIYIVRTDTVFLRVAVDTVHREVIVPVERREYRTDDYFAVVEGFRPRLVKMEVYPETRYVTDTRITTLKKRPRFGVGIQAGYGYSNRGSSPYIGVGVQYNVVCF